MEDDQFYWAIGDRANVMNSLNIRKDLLNLAAFLGTGGRFVEPYQNYLICEGTINWLKDNGRINNDEANSLREQCSLENDDHTNNNEANRSRKQYAADFIRETSVSSLYYLSQAFKER